MSPYEKNLKDKLDDEIKLACLEALGPEEREQHWILNSSRLRTFEDGRLEIVTYLEAKFGLRIRDSKPSDTGSRGHSDPMMLMRSTPFPLAKAEGDRVSVMGVLSVVDHIFNGTAMHAKSLASIRLARANRASHGPIVRAKERVKRTREIPKESPQEPKVPKGCTKVKHRKLVYQVLKTRNQRQARKLRNLHRRVSLTLPGTMVGMVTNGTMAGVLMNGMMTGVRLDGTKDGNKRMTLPQAHFHLEVWMLVPPVVRSCLNG